TAIALEYFRDKQVDLAILEVGMGGIYDSTNVIESVVSVITGIDYDHTQYLGTSLEEIARNKAGIIKNKVPLVMGPVNSPARQVIAARARELESPLYSSSMVKVTCEARSCLEGQWLKLVFSGQVMDKVFLSSPASYQLENLAVAFTALQILKMAGFSWTEGEMKAALAKLRIPGRMEVVKMNPPLILDAAHNPQAASVLASSLEDILPRKKKVLVLGVLDDKDAQNILKPLGLNTRALVLSRPEGSRSKNWKRLRDDWSLLFPGADLYLEEDIIEAIKLGERLLEPGEYLLITGSFYLLDKARKYLTSV
ncbi:MAG: cyanophycin synthetase, partial [Syntrophomonas sp.]|nr:cyanophycin synthetase [Syntrophomonas sp.]